MKKVVNGSLYDTEKSTEIASFQSNLADDLNKMDESLYVSPKGQFFIAGAGGARTKYGKHVGNNQVSGGSDIELLTESKARQWLENHQDHIDEDVVKIYETYFPESLKEG